MIGRPGLSGRRDADDIYRPVTGRCTGTIDRQTGRKRGIGH